LVIGHWSSAIVHFSFILDPFKLGFAQEVEFFQATSPPITVRRAKRPDATLNRPILRITALKLRVASGRFARGTVLVVSLLLVQAFQLIVLNGFVHMGGAKKITQLSYSSHYWRQMKNDQWPMISDK